MHDVGVQHRIDLIYEEMQRLNLAGGDFVVDHIIPIQNQLVCGLHVPWNLNLITRGENSAKGNSFDPDHDFLGKKKAHLSGQMSVCQPDRGSLK